MRFVFVPEGFQSPQYCSARAMISRGSTLPATISTSFQGTAQAFQASFSGLWILLTMAIFVIYIVLGVLYESYIHPITILSGLPAAGFGALITLMIFGSAAGSIPPSVI